jgi:hypothetical protein
MKRLMKFRSLVSGRYSSARAVNADGAIAVCDAVGDI